MCNITYLLLITNISIQNYPLSNNVTKVDKEKTLLLEQKQLYFEGLLKKSIINYSNKLHNPDCIPLGTSILKPPN